MTIARGTPQNQNETPSTEGQIVHGQQAPTLIMSQQSPQSSQGNVPSQVIAQPQDDTISETSAPPPEYQQPEFPVAELARLDEMVNRTRWVVPVLPKCELEVLLDASIALCKAGIDVHCEPCQRFFREGLTISFTKILTDDAVSGWKQEIHRCILKNCEKLIELCVAKLEQDWFVLLDLLAMALNPSCKFHVFTANRPSETASTKAKTSEEEVYAVPPDPRQPRGWLVDLINHFGELGGFQLLLDRFLKGPCLSVGVVAALLKPFGQCFEMLSQRTVEKYFVPIAEIVPNFLESLSDEDLKRESKTEAKNDALTGIVKSLKCLMSVLPKQEELAKSLEIFRLKMVLRLLQISSFNGKMHALNEVNKVITSITYYPHRHNQLEDVKWLTPDKMAEWIQESGVLSIMLRDSLHQPQYVEKLEKIVRFVTKEKSLTLHDLDMIWEAQNGKHDAIVKNIHDLLAKLAWDFSAEQLDHLFECFQRSWVNATKKQREKLLELIRRLAEDDKEGVMANKVLGLLWNLAHNDDVPTEIMDQALAAHVKILDYSCSQDRDNQKMQWIARCVEEVKKDNWVIPALKQIQEICSLFPEAAHNYSSTARPPHILHRNNVIAELQRAHLIVILAADNLTAYIDKARTLAREQPGLEPVDLLPDGRFNHIQQVGERLKFLKFLLKDGHMWLCKPQARQIWLCLAENAVFPCDRENCFKWFGKLMCDEPDLDPEMTEDFFEQSILQLDPALLTENGMLCLERFFKYVNQKAGKLVVKRRGGFAVESLELSGVDYLWRVVLNGSNEVSAKAIQLLKEMHTNLGNKLQDQQMAVSDDFLQYCMNKLRASYDTLSLLEKQQSTEVEDASLKSQLQTEVQRMRRILTALREYVTECDDMYSDERMLLPLARAHRGKHLVLQIRFPNQARPLEDIDIPTHANETLASVRRQILQRLRAGSGVKVELFFNGDVLDPNEDKRLVSQLAFRDRSVLTAKLIPVGSNVASSPDSSSDSSPGSPHHASDGPNLEAENCLPGVLMAKEKHNAEFLLQICDLGIRLRAAELCELTRQVLQIMPPDTHTTDILRTLCSRLAKGADAQAQQSLEQLFFGAPPSKVLYTLEVAYCLLMPALNPLSDSAFLFQCNLMMSNAVSLTLGMLTKNNFLSEADALTTRQAYIVVMKTVKLLLTAVAFANVQVVVDLCNARTPQVMVGTPEHTRAVLLQQAIACMPSPQSEHMMRNVASKIGQTLKAKVVSVLPTMDTLRAMQKIAWAAGGCGSVPLARASWEELHQRTGDALQEESTCVIQVDDACLCREALEALALSLALAPGLLDNLTRDKSWQAFIVDLLLFSRDRSVRQSAADQFFLIATKCQPGRGSLLFFIQLLFTILDTSARECASQSHEYFQLLFRLLNYASNNSMPPPNAEKLLINEIAWLKDVREKSLQSCEHHVDDDLLEGHLNVTRELVAMQSTNRLFQLGTQPGGAQLIKELMDDFLFPASVIVQQYRAGKCELPSEAVRPICSSQTTITAAFELIVALCTGCVDNLRAVVDKLLDMYYAGHDPPPTEWEFQPPIGPRSNTGFSGLKNGGATCYMNSVFQQLFMIEPIRSYLMSVDVLPEGVDEDDGDERLEHELSLVGTDAADEEKRAEKFVKDSAEKNYNAVVLAQVQSIFAQLAFSKLQYCIPRGFWKYFKLMGEPVNLREQHDAYEFFNSLVDSIDEGLKSMGLTPIISKVLGGTFADQKICKGCPHRYSREEPFTALNVDIRNHQNLQESLEQYVKGDLLEGANAYYCDKCSQKVDTVKRMCVKKLPPMLAIQLKRFDYDWERDCAIKFNDYFEFPREFDMDPYTVQGLEKIEGEMISDDGDDVDINKSAAVTCTKYRLTGIVVHSGQASGGHYYSYILHRPAGKPAAWYKFDDGEVSECKMDDDEEMKNQCFGGEYAGEVFDNMMKRRQKRWWNAYMIFYTRLDEDTDPMIRSVTKDIQDLALGLRVKAVVKLPKRVEQKVQRQNILYAHNRMHYSTEYFHFIRRLLTANIPILMQQPLDNNQLSAEVEELAMISCKLATKFLFSIGFRTKKVLRGPAQDWQEAVSYHLRVSKAARQWFVEHALFAHPGRFAEYLLECPSTEVRTAFMRVIAQVAHFSLADGPCTISLNTSISLEPSATLSDYVMVAILELLKKEISEHGRHLAQYFHLFLMYANIGVPEKQHLLRLEVPAKFMLLALEEGPGPPIKYQYAELSKLYAVVALLVRCCDVSFLCSSSQQGAKCQSNPHSELSVPLMQLPQQVQDLLYGRPGYAKRLIEESNQVEDTTKLLRFCCWENPTFSLQVLSELLWQVNYTYTYELRPFLELLLQMLLLEDSWQTHRLHNTLKGIPEDRDGLFEIIQRSKNHYQKRAYQCIKMMVTLFTSCERALKMVQENAELKKKWASSIEWLTDELERRPSYHANAQYGYNNWSPPAQSNETSNGYFLERSQSAKITLARCVELFPQEDVEESGEIGENAGEATLDGGGGGLMKPSVSGHSQLDSIPSTAAKTAVTVQPAALPGSPVRQQVPSTSVTAPSDQQPIISSRPHDGDGAPPPASHHSTPATDPATQASPQHTINVNVPASVPPPSGIDEKLVEHPAPPAADVSRPGEGGAPEGH